MLILDSGPLFSFLAVIVGTARRSFSSIINSRYFVRSTQTHFRGFQAGNRVKHATTGLWSLSRFHSSPASTTQDARRSVHDFGTNRPSQ